MEHDIRAEDIRASGGGMKLRNSLDIRSRSQSDSLILLTGRAERERVSDYYSAFSALEDEW